ncbi:MAG: MarR family transcriptional regulator [Candidatus Peribacteraceae bacterium]|nr:MarR family transcriptional regulator [Candidatus Peribacteraceae bacterium]
MPSEADRIITLVFEISRLLRQRAVVVHEDKSINMLQLHALAHLKEKGNINMKKLADYLRVTFPSATSFADRLVRMGWIKRVSDPINRKLVRLQMTPAGNKILEEKMVGERKIIRPVLDNLSKEDQTHLFRILKIILEQEQVL